MSAPPVVVELFESQGCSSCPPSERTMSRLKQEFGDSVILLTFHVDYWDSLGWKDTFSDGAYTERQKMYAHAFAQDSIYTPEMVVGGRSRDLTGRTPAARSMKCDRDYPLLLHRFRSRFHRTHPRGERAVHQAFA